MRRWWLWSPVLHCCVVAGFSMDVDMDVGAYVYMHACVWERKPPPRVTPGHQRHTYLAKGQLLHWLGQVQSVRIPQGRASMASTPPKLTSPNTGTFIRVSDWPRSLLPARGCLFRAQKTWSYHAVLENMLTCFLRRSAVGLSGLHKPVTIFFKSPWKRKAYLLQYNICWTLS